jgi:hypothetical protein
VHTINRFREWYCKHTRFSVYKTGADTLSLHLIDETLPLPTPPRSHHRHPSSSPRHRSRPCSLELLLLCLEPPTRERERGGGGGGGKWVVEERIRIGG